MQYNISLTGGQLQLVFNALNANAQMLRDLGDGLVAVAQAQEEAAKASAPAEPEKAGGTDSEPDDPPVVDIPTE